MLLLLLLLLPSLLFFLLLQDGAEGDIKVWREMARERILRSADSALIILHIITTPRMPKKVHLEESIDQVLALTKFHLDNNVYPQFDPVYRAENKGWLLVHSWSTGGKGKLGRERVGAGGRNFPTPTIVLSSVS